MSPDTIFKKNEGLVSRMVEDGLVIVSPILGEVRVLNEIGAMIWDALDGHASVDDLKNRLCIAFPKVPEAQIVGDLHLFMEELSTKALILPINGPKN